MKQLDEWEFFMDCFGLYKESKDGMIEEDEDGQLVEIDDKTPMTYGMVKELMSSFIEELKSDLKDIVDMIPDE